MKVLPKLVMESMAQLALKHFRLGLRVIESESYFWPCHRKWKFFLTLSAKVSPELVIESESSSWPCQEAGVSSRLLQSGRQSWVWGGSEPISLPFKFNLTNIWKPGNGNVSGWNIFKLQKNVYFVRTTRLIMIWLVVLIKPMPAPERQRSMFNVPFACALSWHF